jgi:hypothetical protein
MRSLQSVTEVLAGTVEVAAQLLDSLGRSFDSHKILLRHSGPLRRVAL